MPYALSAVAAVVYVVATFALATNRRRLALAAVGIEMVGVLVVGVTSLLLPQDYPDATVWSDFGAGYGFVPLVLPVRRPVVAAARQPDLTAAPIGGTQASDR